jgi:tetratricopeptide (TPR) repeat protein
MKTSLLIAIILCRAASVGLLSAGEPEQATLRECLRASLEAAREIDQRPRREEVLRDIGLTQAYSGDLAGARGVVDEIKNAEWAASILAAIGLAQARQGDRVGAKATLTEAMERTKHVSDNRLLMYAILDAYLAAEEFTEATETVSKSADPLDRAHAQIYIIEAYLAAGRREEAETLLRELTAGFRRTWDFFDMPAWERIWQLQLELGDVAGALKLARAIPKHDWHACRALSDVAMHQAKSGDTAAAAATFAEAFEAVRWIGRTEEAPPDESAEIAEMFATVAAGHREVQMAAVVTAQARAGDVAGAVKNLDRIPDCEPKLQASLAVAEARAKAGDQAGAHASLEQAIAMLQRMPHGYDPAWLASVAACQGKLGQMTVARVTLAKALNAAREIEYPCWWRAYSFAGVAKAQAEIGDRAAAEKTLAEAQKALAEAVRRTRAVSGAELRAAEFAAKEAEDLAEAQIEAGFHDAAQATLREILLPAIPKLDDGDDAAILLEHAPLLLAKAGDFATAYETARKPEEPSDRAAAMRSVAAYHTLTRGPGEPLAVAAKETGPHLRSVLCLGAALGLLKNSGVDVRNHYGLSLIDD